jgi:hypothetical protein
MFISQTISDYKYQSVSLTGEKNARMNYKNYYNRFSCSSSLKNYNSYMRTKHTHRKALSTSGGFYNSNSRSGHNKNSYSQIFLIL